MRKIAALHASRRLPPRGPGPLRPPRRTNMLPERRSMLRFENSCNMRRSKAGRAQGAPRQGIQAGSGQRGAAGSTGGSAHPSSQCDAHLLCAHLKRVFMIAQKPAACANNAGRRCSAPGAVPPSRCPPPDACGRSRRQSAGTQPRHLDWAKLAGMRYQEDGCHGRPLRASKARLEAARHVLPCAAPHPAGTVARPHPLRLPCRPGVHLVQQVRSVGERMGITHHTLVKG